MTDGKVVIKVSGDDAELQKELKQTTTTAKAAAAAIGAEYQKAGMTQSAAMKKAWAEVKAAQQNGTSVVVKGVEVMIRKNEDLSDSVRDLGRDAYEPLADSAEQNSSRISRAFSAVKSGSASAVVGLRAVAPAAKMAFKGITLVTGAATALWNAVGLATVQYNGDLEQLQTSFATMTGSEAKGAEVLERIRALGASTPFEMQGLAETTQLLMNYNLTADDALAKMTMLGDISQGNQEKLTRIATAYGQMSSAGKVALEDVKQMIEAGFNPLVEISEATGESMASLYNRISKGTLAVDEITASMERSTSAGGKYFQSMTKQSQTLIGQISTLKDNAQQLGGNVFQSYTDGLRDSVIPAANDIVEELNDAFMTRGMDGLTDAVIAQIPQVSSAVGTAFKNGIENAGKQAPKYIKGLISTLPSLLAGGGEITNVLAELFFDAAAAGLEGLWSHAPELISGAADFGLQLGGNIVKGVMNSVIGAGRGMGTSLKKLGILGWSADELMDQVFDGYDADKVRELKAKVNITPEATIDESKVKLDDIYEIIAKQLTDGEADSPEMIAELKKQVTDYYDAEIEKVNQWKQEALSGLDTSLPQDEYAAAAEAIQTEADSMIASLQSASTQTVKFLDDNAGKSTQAVKDNLADLEAIYQNAVGYRDKIAALTGEAGSMAERQRQVVAAGQSRDSATQLSAIGYTAMEYETAVQAAEEKKNAALNEALDMFEKGSDEYAQREAEILAAFEAEKKAAADSYQANMSAVWAGIGQSMMPEQQALLQEAQGALRVRDLTETLLGSMNKAIEEVGAHTDASAYTEWFSNMLGGMALGDADYADIAAMLGIDEVDPEKIRAALAQQLAGATAGQGENSLLGVMLKDMNTGAEGDLSTILPQLAEGVPEELKMLLQAAIEEGFMTGVEGVDLSDSEAILTLLAGAMPSKEEAITIGKPAGEAVVDGIEAGAKSREAHLMATVKRMAQGVAGMISSTLEIKSPSRVTRRLGAYTGKGFEIGLVESMNRAVKHAGSIAGSLNLSPKLTAPDLTGAFSTAAASMSEGMSQPIYLNVDGRTLAQVTVGNNARAANQFNRNIALGVGK